MRLPRRILDQSTFATLEHVSMLVSISPLRLPLSYQCLTWPPRNVHGWMVAWHAGDSVWDCIVDKGVFRTVYVIR
jgi:hypothetical protein